MPDNRVYLLHPNERQHPGLREWVDEVRGLIATLPEWAGWEIATTAYDDRGRFEVPALHVRVNARHGPVVLLYPFHNELWPELRARLEVGVVVSAGAAGDPTELWTLLDQARARHISGEPFLPRRLVVAVLIVRKLRARHLWAGHNDKGYIWANLIAKGQGVDERFAPIVPLVVGRLTSHKLLIWKTSQGAKKYALNPDIKPTVHAFADNLTIVDPNLRRWLLNDETQEPASILAGSQATAKICVKAGERPPTDVRSVEDALRVAKECPDSPKYEAQITYDDGRCVSESFLDRGMLVRFLEALTT